jgi:hypothetical protein
MEKKPDDPVEDALDHLHRAQRHQAEARAEEAAADREIIEAEAELEEAVEHTHHGGSDCDDDEIVRVHFVHLADREKATFPVNREDSLKAIWDLAYKKLDVAPGERDILQATHNQGTPTSLMDYLSLTLKDAQHRELCDVNFEIAARTGGA